MNSIPDSLLGDLRGRWKSLERAVFRISGPDRVRYLNGQVTNDVSKLGDGQSLPACLCTIKGKVEALVWIRAAGEDLLLDGELRQRDFLSARLDRYLIADDCLIEDLTESLDLVHHFAEERAGSPSRRLLRPGWDLLLPKGSGPGSSAEAISDEEWEAAALVSRLPRSGEEINADEFPSELGLDTWAVDFHKGCYLGQEIVSRLQSVGRAKRKLILVSSPLPLDRGARVRTAEGLGGLSTRKSLRIEENRHVALALVGIGSRSSESGDFQAVVEIPKSGPEPF